MEEKRRENGESGTKSSSLSTPPSPDASLARLRHRTKLGNNITPTREELRKNTTPTSRGPSELNASSGSPGTPPTTTTKPGRFIKRGFQLRLKKEEGSKHELHRRGDAIYKEARALGKSCNRFQFSISLH